MKWSNILLRFLVITAIIYSCNKMALNKPPLGALQQSDLENKAGVEGLLIGAYAALDGYGTNAELLDYGRSVSNWIFGSICGSEAYKGSTLSDQNETIAPIEEFEATAYNPFFEQKWTSIYDGIARTNTVLRVMREAKDMTTADTTEVRAEALFLRAFFHFEAKKMWNNIQMVDEKVTYDAGNYQIGNDTSWSLIENDLRYASVNLPRMQQRQPGRANKYAAEAFLAKAYMFEHKFSAADSLLKDIINNGVNTLGLQYSLEKKYQDNFHPSTKNGSESVFSVQMDVDDGSGGANGTIGDQLAYPGPIGGYGFFSPSQYLVNHFKTDSATGLPDLDHFNDSALKNDWHLTSTDSFTPYQGTLDPRLDWTVGRRGIPYLDWGPETGADWVRDQPDENYGPYAPKKNIIYQNEQAKYSDNSWGTKITANNIDLIRFADVLLWEAEAQVELGNFESARGYVNQVRQRAGNSSSFVYQYNINPATALQDPTLGNSNIPAANYKVGLYAKAWTNLDTARKAVRFERMLELGMEGHRFFDLVRWGIADTEINNYLNIEMTRRNYLIGIVFTKNKNEYFPIPATEISLSNGKMKQNPGY